MTIEKLLKNKLFLAIMITVMICIMVSTGLLVGLWSYLTNYENNTPQYYINKLLDSIEQGDIEFAMKQVGVNTSKFLTSQDYQQYMYDMLGTDFSKLKVIQESESGEKAVYAISSVESKKISLELNKKVAKKEFGTDAYTMKQTLPLKSMKIIAPANVKLKVNGVVLTEQEKAKTTESVVGFQTIEDKALIPQLVTYQISGFLYEPKVSVEELTPQEFIMDKKDGLISITLPACAEAKKQVEDFAVQASKAYANYVSKDAKFADYSQFVLKDTSYYKSIRSFDNSWYIEHDSATFTNAKVCDTLAYSDNHFSTTVSFDYIVAKGRTKRTYPTKYKLSIIKQGNTFRIVNLESL